MLIRLLWLLPSVVNERGNSLAFCSCLRLLIHFAVYLEGGPCGYGALSTGRSSETEPYLSSSTSSLLRRWKTSWVQNFVTPGLVTKITKISTPRNNPLYGILFPVMLCDLAFFQVFFYILLSVYSLAFVIPHAVSAECHPEMPM